MKSCEPDIYNLGRAEQEIKTQNQARIMYDGLMDDRHSDPMSTVAYIGTLMQALLNRGFTIRQLGEEAGDEWSILELQQLLEGIDVGVGSQSERVDRTLRCFEELHDGSRAPLHAPQSPPGERTGIRRGRPPVGSPRGESPVVKGRVTPAEWDELKEIQAATDRSLAELVRRGVQLVIAEHRQISGQGDRAAGGDR